MQYRSNKGYTAWGQFGVLLLLGGLGLVMASLVQIFIGMMLVPEGTSLLQLGDEMLKALSDPRHLTAVRWMQILSTLFLFFLPALFYSWITQGKEWFWLGFNPHFRIFQVMIGFMLIYTANLFGHTLYQGSVYIIHHFPTLDKLAQSLERTYNEQVTLMGRTRDVTEFIFVLVLIALLPAVFEEVFFRGVLQPLLVRWWKSPWLGILATSLLFSLIHFSVYLFLTRAVLGIVLGVMFHLTRNLWVNIIAHFINNALAAAQMYMLSRQNKPVDVNALDGDVAWWMGLIAAVVVVFLFQWLDRYSEDQRMRIYAKEQRLQARYPGTGHPFAGHHPESQTLN